MSWLNFFCRGWSNVYLLSLLIMVLLTCQKLSEIYGKIVQEVLERQTYGRSSKRYKRGCYESLARQLNIPTHFYKDADSDGLRLAVLQALEKETARRSCSPEFQTFIRNTKDYLESKGIRTDILDKGNVNGLVGLMQLSNNPSKVWEQVVKDVLNQKDDASEESIFATNKRFKEWYKDVQRLMVEMYALTFKQPLDEKKRNLIGDTITAIMSNTKTRLTELEAYKKLDASMTDMPPIYTVDSTLARIDDLAPIVGQKEAARLKSLTTRETVATINSTLNDTLLQMSNKAKQDIADALDKPAKSPFDESKEQLQKLRKVLVDMVAKLPGRKGMLNMKFIEKADVENQDMVKDYYMRVLSKITELRNSLESTYRRHCLPSMRREYNNHTHVYYRTDRDLWNQWNLKDCQEDSLIYTDIVHLDELISMLQANVSHLITIDPAMFNDLKQQIPMKLEVSIKDMINAQDLD